MSNKRIFIVLAIFLFCGCSDLKERFQKKTSIKAEPILRKSEDTVLAQNKLVRLKKEKNPWEKEGENLEKITSQFFRCKGSPLNPPLFDEHDPNIVYYDCEGFAQHGLSVVHQKEGVYPILLDLLNYIREKTNQKIVITCGHSCEKHSFYTERKRSLHTIGAEVDFFVQNKEYDFSEIVELIFQFYKENKAYKGNQDFEYFYAAWQKELKNKVWYNKEVLIKVFSEDEGRDANNRHPYPYISIQVLYDRDLREKVLIAF